MVVSFRFAAHLGRVARAAGLAALAGLAAVATAACGEADPADDAAEAGLSGESDASPLDGDDAFGPRPDALRPPARPSGSPSGGADATTGPDDDADAAAGTELDAGSAPATDAAPVSPPAEVCRRMRVVNTLAEGLNVRPDPSTAQPALTVWFDGTEAEVLAEVMGQDIDGNSLWYEVQGGGVHGFVSTVFAECIARGAPPAPPPPPGPRDDVFLLPFRCGESYTVTQGNNSDFSHNGAAAWAFDFGMPFGTPMVAMKPGDVLFTHADTRPGDPCWDGGDRDCVDAANYVVLGHADGTRTRYAHLSGVAVAVGQHVAQGELLGETGSTGWSTGPHAHVARIEACNAAYCNSIPLAFADVPGEGVPVEDMRVTSENGCAN